MHLFFALTASSRACASQRLNLSSKPEEQVTAALAALTPEQLASVRQLWLVDCKLHKLPQNIDKMTNLWGLYLSGHNNYVSVFYDLTGAAPRAFFLCVVFLTSPASAHSAALLDVAFVGFHASRLQGRRGALFFLLRPPRSPSPQSTHDHASTQRMLKHMAAYDYNAEPKWVRGGGDKLD